MKEFVECTDVYMTQYILTNEMGTDTSHLGVMGEEECSMQDVTDTVLREDVSWRHD